MTKSHIKQQIVKKGYSIVKGTFRIEDALLQKELGLRSRYFRHIFSKAKGRSRRYQRNIQKSDKSLQSILDQVGTLTSVIFPEHVIHKPVVLMSLPGCAVQPAHSDFLPGSLCKNDEDGPFGCLIALMPNTSLEVWPSTFARDLLTRKRQYPTKSIQLKLEQGDICLFQSDLIHAGSANHSKTPHYRMHFYGIRPKKDRFVNNRTWRVDGQSREIKACVTE